MTAIARVWDRIWFSDGSLLRLGVFRVCILTIAATATFFPTDVITSYTGTSGGEVGHKWNPVYFIEILGTGAPDAATARVLVQILIAAFIMAIVGLFTRASTLVVALLAVYWWGLGYSFGQAHHEKISLAFAVLVLPFSPCGARFSVDAWIARWRRRPAADTSPFAIWPIRLVQVSIAVSYLFAGASKVVVSGLEWMNGFTLQAIMFAEEDPFAKLIAGNVWFAQLASIFVITLQASFPLIFLHRHLRWFYVPGAAAFHLGAWVTMNPGPYYTLWLTSFVTFFHIERIPFVLRDGWTAGHRKKTVVQLITLYAFATLSIRIMIRDLPAWLQDWVQVAAACAALALASWTLRPGKGP